MTCEKAVSRRCRMTRTIFTWVSCFVVTSCIVGIVPAAAGELSITTDERAVVQDQGLGETGDRHVPGSRTSGDQDSESAPRAESERGLQLDRQKQQITTPTNPSLEDEPKLMAEVVQTLDRESASLWLAGFISLKPWNCPIPQRNQWIEAILCAVERNQLPICKQILGLVATIISIESGFHADPLVGESSRRGSMERLLKRAELKLFEEYGSLMSLPPVPKYYAAYKDNYWPQLLACRTESEVERVARRIANELKQDAQNFPAAVKTLVDQKVGKLENVVRSKGSMQLKLLRARPALKNRGEDFTDEELIEYMYTLNGGVDVGVAALKPLFIQYGARYAKKGDLSWLFFVGMDYHYGPFSSRNMMEQVRIRDLSGQKIAVDGSFLNHDEEGKPAKEESETLLAAQEALPFVSPQEILKAFLLERDPKYIYTDVHRLIVEAHRERFGETPFAVIGETRMGETAEIKFGVTWTTRLYLNKLDRYLNSIPWDK